MKTREQIAARIIEADEAVQSWEQSDEIGSFVQWQGKPHKAISEALFADWVDLLETVAGNDDIADDAKLLVIEIDHFDGAFQRWEEGVTANSESTNPGGTSELWNAWRSLVAQANRKVVRKLPTPIRELIEVQKVSDRQIAVQYGWFRADGTVDVAKVREELESPGTHYSPETWVHPSDARRQKQANELWAKRVSRWTPKGQAKARKEAPETIDELILQGVGSNQIALMKGVSVEEVRDRAAYLGRPIDGGVPVRSTVPAERMADIRREEAEQTERARRASEPVPYPDQKRLPEKIQAMHNDGMTPGEIVDALRWHFASVTTEKVLRIVESEATAAG